MKILYTLLFLLSAGICYGDAFFEKEVKPYLKDYCLRCHGDEKQKGDRRYDNIKIDFNHEATAILWQDILDQLLLEEMPPKKPFPAAEKNKKVITWISNKFAKLRAESAVSKNGTVMRRLSHLEYTNSLKALFNLELPNFNLTRGLTDDNIIDGFDTEAKQLKTTPYLFSKYLEIADRFIDKSYPSPKPQSKTQLFTGKQFNNNRDSLVLKPTKKTSYVAFFGKIPDASRSFIKNFTAPEDGIYKFTLNAEAINRDKNWKIYRSPKPGTPWKMKFIASSAEYGPLSKPNLADYPIATLSITDDKKSYQFEGFLRKGFNVVMYWENGGSGQPGAIRAQAKLKGPDYLESINKIGRMWSFLKFYKGPYIKLNSFSVKGPFFKSWPLQPVSTVYGTNPPAKPDLAFAKKSLLRFASRAWRRPVKETELTPIIQLVQKNLEQEGYQAIGKGLKAIVCSPGFLYHNQNKGKLNDFALAARLSFFLWGRSPDLELLRLAHRRQLSNPKVYNAQISRLLKSPHTRDFSNNFSKQWLNLERAQEMPPDEVAFKKFYQENIDRHMVAETQEFISYLLKNNLSIYNCLDSEFAILNETMAEYYKIKTNVKGDHFRKVQLAKNSFHGGLLSQASVLTATSNGVETSPIVRGVWVLEKLLGTHPTPPPADVEPLEPDIRGSKTIKERLNAHRAKESCNECHRKFDYLGLALENYNPIGEYRLYYNSKKKIKVDAKSEAPDGSSLKNIKDLKTFLMKRKSLFARGLTEKLLAYGTGRKMSYLERSQIDKIVKALQAKSGFADLLRHVANSEVFKHK